jgi:non-specific serine/threonine protein kinase
VALLDEALTLRRELDDRRGIATTLEGLGLAAHGLGDPARAAALLEECLALWEELGGPPMTDLRANLAEVVRDLGDYGRAVALHEENLREYRQQGHRHGELVSLRGLGHLARLQEQFARADGLLSPSLGLVVELQDARCAPVCLEEVACLASVQGWASGAARLFGAAETLREAGGFALPPEHAEYDRHVGVARAALAPDQFSATWAGGRAMSLEQAAGYAASPSDRETPVSAHQSTTPGGASARRPAARRAGDVLSPREREVAGLVARGLTDPQIAEALVIGRRTAETHVARCLGKLGLATRAQLATWVTRQAHDP